MGYVTDFAAVSWHIPLAAYDGVTKNLFGEIALVRSRCTMALRMAPCFFIRTSTKIVETGWDFDGP